MTVREADGPDDMGTVRTIMRAYGQHLQANPGGAASICLAGFERELQDLPKGYDPPGGCLLLAEQDGVPAGCVALRTLTSGADGERSCEMKRLWVGGEFRGMGVGRLLVAAALRWAKDRSYEWMYLDTVPAAMPEANRLYGSLGFMRVERYNQNPVRDVAFFRRRV